MTTLQSLNAIAICQIIITVLFFITAGAIVFAIVMLKKMLEKKLNQAIAMMQPVVDKAKVVADQAQTIAVQAKETTENVSAKVEAMIDKAESTADNVESKIRVASVRVDEALNPQVMTAAGIVGIGLRLFQLYRDITKIREESKTVHLSTMKREA